MIYMDNLELKKLVLEKAFPNQELEVYRNTYYEIKEDEVVFTIKCAPFSLTKSKDYQYTVADSAINAIDADPIHFYKARRAYEAEQLEAAFAKRELPKIRAVLKAQAKLLLAEHKLSVVFKIEEEQLSYPNYTSRICLYNEKEKMFDVYVCVFLAAYDKNRASLNERLKGCVSTLFNRLLKLLEGERK